MNNEKVILTCKRLNKSFGPTHAVNDVSFKVKMELVNLL